MNIKKTGEIEYKVFKERDLYNLVKYFLNVKKELNYDDADLRLNIEFEDGTSIIGHYKSIINETKTKIVKSIHFTLSNYRINKAMNIFIITNGGKYEVESEDRDWTDAKFAQLEEILKLTPNQNYWLSNFKRQALLNNLIGMTLGFVLYFFIFRKLIGEEDLNNMIAYSLSSFVVSIIFSQIIVYLFMEQFLYKLYPKIEFDTTSDHLNKNKKKKVTILSFFLLVILPLILSFLSNVIF